MPPLFCNVNYLANKSSSENRSPKSITTNMDTSKKSTLEIAICLQNCSHAFKNLSPDRSGQTTPCCLYIIWHIGPGIKYWRQICHCVCISLLLLRPADGKISTQPYRLASNFSIFTLNKSLCQLFFFIQIFEIFSMTTELEENFYQHLKLCKSYHVTSKIRNWKKLNKELNR